MALRHQFLPHRLATVLSAQAMPRASHHGSTRLSSSRLAQARVQVSRAGSGQGREREREDMPEVYLSDTCPLRSRQNFIDELSY